MWRLPCWLAWEKLKDINSKSVSFRIYPSCYFYPLHNLSTLNKQADVQNTGNYCTLNNRHRRISWGLSLELKPSLCVIKVLCGLMGKAARLLTFNQAVDVYAFEDFLGWRAALIELKPIWINFHQKTALGGFAWECPLEFPRLIYSVG